jgi:uncharacterized membrane protein
MSGSTTWLRAAALGAATGGRSMTPLAAVSRAAATGKLQIHGSPLAFLARPAVAGVLKLMAAGELLLDKLPCLPPRTNPPSLAWRIALGGACGAMVASIDERPVVPGILLAASIGATAAAASSFMLMRIRLSLGRMGLPDAVVAIAEDALVIAISRAAVCGLGLSSGPRRRRGCRWDRWDNCRHG